VRPAAGIVQPGGSEEIQVLLHFPKEKLPEEKDKFQILSIPISKEQAATDILKTVWANASDDDVTKQRLKCIVKIVGDAPYFPPTIPHTDSESKDVELKFHDASSIALTQSSSQSTSLAHTQLGKEETLSSSPVFSQVDSIPPATPFEYVKPPAKLNVETLASVTSERDQLLKDVQRLREELSKQKEDNLRQRKTVSSPESQQKGNTSPPSALAIEQQLPELLQNRIIQYLLIAFIFFILGKLL